MPEVPHRLKHHLGTQYDTADFVGFMLLYILVIFVVPYILFHHASFEVFVTYFANVDIVANLLAINFPDYFIKWYSVYNDTLRGYISFNTISVIALSGIFYFGLTARGRTRRERWAIMIIMSIVTWTLPTLGIPYMNNRIEQFLQENDHVSPEKYDTYRLLITVAISFLFLQVERLLIHSIKELNL